MRTSAHHTASRATLKKRLICWAGIVRNLMLWHTPFLQQLVLWAARRRLMPSWVWRRLRPYGVWELHAPDGTPFAYDCANHHDGLAPHIVWTDLRDWEAGTQPVLYGLAREARVFVDVGAYSGIYTILACTANPELTAVAFEPNPVKMSQLRANVAVNGLEDRVSLIGKAVGDRPGKGILVIPCDDSQASLINSGTGVRTVGVEVTTGDVALRGLPVDLMKIDVEGLETAVLTGMREILTGCQPDVIAECLTPDALTQLCDCLESFGYEHGYRIDDHGLAPVGRCSFRAANYLLTPDPRRVEQWLTPGSRYFRSAPCR